MVLVGKGCSTLLNNWDFIKGMIMTKETFQFQFEVYGSVDELTSADKQLVEAARIVTEKAYAPFCKFLVGAVARLKNGELVSGTNQENAAYPVGICAERVLLSSAAMLHTNIQIDTMAVTYHNTQGESNEPVSPCGLCRQSLVEYEERQGGPIRLILTGMAGKVFILDTSGQLLPLSFGSGDLKVT
jgi:cytidine deaminase